MVSEEGRHFKPFGRREGKKKIRIWSGLFQAPGKEKERGGAHLDNEFEREEKGGRDFHPAFYVGGGGDGVAHIEPGPGKRKRRESPKEIRLATELNLVLGERQIFRIDH